MEEIIETPYSDELQEGSTKEMYVSKTEKKTYVYHSSNYLLNNINDIDMDKICYTSPIDVSNYYMAFHTFPANYYFKDDDYSYEYKNAFGEYARLVSEYSRTSGYALSVPCNTAPGSSRPIYYELDIDLDGNYSTSSRGVGRVVIWKYGFSCYSTSKEEVPVCLYTDDHYFTFREYNNMGEFMPRFDATGNLSGKKYCPLGNS